MTNTPRSSPPPYPPASGPAASVAPRQPSRLLYHDDRPPFPTAVYGRPPLSQAEDLPPISHAIHSSGETPSPPCHSTGTSPLVPSRPGYPVHHGTITSSGRTSPPETPAGAAGEIQNQPHPVRPHVVDEKHIEGEGLCYIYADGSYCPKIIDGVPVNANWGVTKAGKPRKRLAQACLTCREKKIKCHPNLPKCDQCQKSGRHCRFENA